MFFFAQCHSPAFPEALLGGLGETLQFGWRDPIVSKGISKESLPDALEDIFLHRRIKLRHEYLQVGVELVQGTIGVVPGPARPMAEGAPVIRCQLRSHGCWCIDERFRGPVQGCHPWPSSIQADEGQVMRRGRAVM